jgi:hypothetical protein
MSLAIDPTAQTTKVDRTRPSLARHVKIGLAKATEAPRLQVTTVEIQTRMAVVSGASLHQTI